MKDRPIRVFVSATPDLEPEREVIGEALARFPVPLAWEIGRTPHRGEQTPEALDQVLRSDLFLVLLGADASAPVGAELLAAQRAQVPTLALIKDGPHTPAGRFFRYNSLDEWQPFAGPRALRRLVIDWLARALVRDPIRLGMTVEETAGLLEFLEETKESETEMVSGKGEPQGAQEGAVIVSGRLNRSDGKSE